MQSNLLGWHNKDHICIGSIRCINKYLIPLICWFLGIFAVGMDEVSCMGRNGPEARCPEPQGSDREGARARSSDEGLRH